MTITNTIFTNALGIMMLIYIGMNLVDYGIHLYLNLRREIKSTKQKG